MSVLYRVSSFISSQHLLQTNLPKRFLERGLKIAVLGANGKTGRTVSLLLKQCPKFKEIALYDKESTTGLAAELDMTDTASTVKAGVGKGGLAATVKGSNLVVIIAGVRGDTDSFETNAPTVASLSEYCANLCPNALLTIVTSPINSLVPMVTEIYRRVNKVVDHNRIFGFTSGDALKASSFVSEILSIPPDNITVPLVGGSGPDTAVPVLNNFPLGTEEAVRVTTCTREAVDKQPPLSAAFAVARFLTGLANALTGARNIIESAYVHSHLFTHSPSTYLSTPIYFGATGMERNLGIPPLSNYEQCLLEIALPTIQKDIEKGIKFGQEFKLQH